MEDFADILDLPHDGPYFKLDEQGNNFNYKNVAFSFMINPTYQVLYPFTIQSMRPDIRLIHYVENRILFPRKRKFTNLNRSHVDTVWLLSKKIEKNCASAMIQYMFGRKRKGILLLYGDLVMKILEHVRYDFEGEEYMQGVTKIREAVLGMMWYKIINGEIIQKHPK